MSFLGGELRQGIDTRRVLDDPILFSKEILGVELWSKQREILGALWGGNDVDVQSCHSAGKTKVAAVATLGWVARPGGSLLPRHRAGIRCGYVVRPIWTSQPVYQERPHPTEHDRPTLPACHIPAERGTGEVRLHPASSEKLSPVAARSHGATGTVQAVAPPDNQHHAMTSGGQMIPSSL